MILTGKQVKYRGTVTGLRISAVDGTAFIDNALITPELQNAKLLSSGSVTAANLKLSAVDGTAFVDFSTADVLTDNIGKYIVIKDSTGKEIKGWIKAAGTGETLGDETFVDVGFADAGSWSVTGTNPTWVITGGKASVTNSSRSETNRILQNVGGNQGTLFKVGGTVDVLSSGAISVTVSGIIGNSPNITTTGSFNRYIAKSSVTAGIGFRCSLPGTTAQIDDVSCKQVLTPSSSGATIVSAKGGETYNFSYKNPSFTYNSSSYYCIIKLLR